MPLECTARNYCKQCLQRSVGILEPSNSLLRRELRSGNKIDATELRLEDGLFKSFDEIIRRQLDSVWHTVSYKTKQVEHPSTCSLTLSMAFKATEYLRMPGLGFEQATEKNGDIWFDLREDDLSGLERFRLRCAIPC